MSSHRENIKKSLIEKLGVPVVDILEAAGREAQRLSFRAFLVGGLVRDLYLGKNNVDVDLVIEGDGIEFAKVFARRYSEKLRFYERFGTATITFPAGFKIDVATARVETYDRPAALPRVRPGRIEDDMYRRDFTINAMAIALSPLLFGEILDPFDGRADIEKKKIRVLHERSFIDDPTRIFRALRFEGRLGFRMEEPTERLIQDALAAGMLERLEDYRIATELNLILQEENPRPMIHRLEALGVIVPIRDRARGSRLIRKILNEVVSVADFK
jgi:tRNA nucleotidyltransferase (CCA-adding enzyme)